MKIESAQQPKPDQDEHNSWLVSQSDEAMQKAALSVAQPTRLQGQSGMLSS